MVEKAAGLSACQRQLQDFSWPMWPELLDEGSLGRFSVLRSEHGLANNCRAVRSADPCSLGTPLNSTLQATEPITAETTFQIWSRISLRTALEQYPVFDKKSLRQMMSYTDQLKKSETGKGRVLEGHVYEPCTFTRSVT